MAIYRASLSLQRLSGPDFDAPAAFGKHGGTRAEDKREGDGKSPFGAWPVRKGWWRPDRVRRPAARIVIDPTNAHDGWCDDPSDPAYNRPVVLPYPARCETLWREDGLYDLVVGLGHNDDPPLPGLGSAIFLHCAAPDGAGSLKPTLGCVAVPLNALAALVERLEPGDIVEIAP